MKDTFEWFSWSLREDKKKQACLRSSLHSLPRRLPLWLRKYENHVWMVALYAVFYNFCKVRKTLRVTPAMEAGLMDRVLTFEDVVTIMDHVAPKPAKRGPYRKRLA